MPDADPEQRPVVEYGTPARRKTGLLVAGQLLGGGAAVVLVIGSALIGASDDGGIGFSMQGLLIGGAVGLGLVVAAAITAISVGRHRGSVFLRGTAQGLLLSLGLGALAFGLCAMMV